MNKLRVAILMGGPSAEHEVSWKSGQMVLEYIDKARYDATPIVIGKDGRWPMPVAELKKKFDVAFIAMHGEYGEDGTIQELLEKQGVKFTGSGSVASRLGMNKLEALKRFAKAGLRVPLPPTKFPVVVKPADRGSSVGVSIAKTPLELVVATKLALTQSPNVMFEQFIKGREFTCGVLEVNKKAKALPPTEIIPKSEAFFNFDAKYTAGATREITPPQLPPAKIKALQRAALTAHNAIGASGMSRTDFIMDEGGRIYTLEINTIPGMTKTSLLPQEATAAGITFPELIDAIIRAAL